ncbi:hypothetical protein ISCGN_014620 [Ixodes scapularis]
MAPVSHPGRRSSRTELTASEPPHTQAATGRRNGTAAGSRKAHDRMHGASENRDHGLYISARKLDKPRFSSPLRKKNSTASEDKRQLKRQRETVSFGGCEGDTSLITSGRALQCTRQKPPAPRQGCKKPRIFATTSYMPEEHISIEESLMLYKERLSWKQFLPLKRSRFGVKLYVLCESTTGCV